MNIKRAASHFFMWLGIVAFCFGIWLIIVEAVWK